MMILNMKLEGYPEEILEEIVHRGIASNKSEAIRIMILHYNEHFGIKPLRKAKEEKDGEEQLYQKALARSNKEMWDNEGDEKMSQWYLEKAKK